MKGARSHAGSPPEAREIKSLFFQCGPAYQVHVDHFSDLVQESREQSADLGHSADEM